MPRRGSDTFRLEPAFWELPEVWEAVLARDIAQILRLVQRETGASQRQIGERIDISQSQVSEILGGRGRQVGMLDVVQRIIRGLGMPEDQAASFFAGRKVTLSDTGGRELPRQHVDSTDDSSRDVLIGHSDPAMSASRGEFDGTLTLPDPGSPMAGEHPGWDPVEFSPEAGWASMLRRTFLLTPPALAASALLARPGHGEADSSIDPATVHGIVEIARHYRRAYHTVPASKLLPTAVSHLDLILSLRPKELAEFQRIPLITAAGEMAALAGVLLGLDATRYDAANGYFDMAWSVARSVSDLDLQAVVLASRSFIPSYGAGDHVSGLRCADLAYSIAAQGASSQTRAWTAAVASERAASLNDLSGAQRRLDQSRQALSSPDFENITWRGIGGYDAIKLRAYEGGNMVRLRRYRDAYTALDKSVNSFDTSMRRHRATALLDRAEAIFGLGDIDAACADAQQALSLVMHVQHTGHLDRIESIARRGLNGNASARALLQEVQLVRVDNGLPISKVRI